MLKYIQSLPPVSKRKAEAIANGAFLIGLGVLFATNAWWPGILLAIWVSLAIRQYLTGRMYDLTISSVIMLGLFFISLFKLDWSILMPILFVVGGIYIIFREYFFAADADGEDKSEEIIDDIDDTTKNRTK
jgi:hypothetical protein